MFILNHNNFSNTRLQIFENKSMTFNFHEHSEFIIIQQTNNQALRLMNFLIDAFGLFMLVIPHVIVNTLKLFFLKKKSFKKWLTHVYYSSAITLMLIIAFKRKYLINIKPLNKQNLEEYHNSILMASIYTSLLLFNFQFKFPVDYFKECSKIRIFIYILCLLIVIFSFTFNQLYQFSFDSWGKIEFSQIMFNLMNPTKDEHAVRFYGRFIRHYFKPSLYQSIYTFIIFSVCTPFRVSYEYNLKFFQEDSGPSFIISIPYITSLLFAVKLIHTVNDFEVFTSNNFIATSIYEDNYVNPANIHLQFPEEKRNLIYIYLESFENTFASRKIGGGYRNSLIPELESLFMEPNNVHFSHNTQIGGYTDLPLMCWSAAGVFTTQSGIPLKPFFFPDMHCFPNIITMTDILNTNGYATHLASSTPFNSWGTSLVFNTHNTEIHDPSTIFREKPKYWEIRRGRYALYDYSIYDYAKEKIEEIVYNESKPFFMAIDTIETHCPDGILCPLCKDAYPELRRYNKARKCAGKRVYDFVRWVQEQPYANNTTIFIVGDHLAMSKDMYRNKDIPRKYLRTVFNLIINSPLKPVENTTQNRKFAAFDWFPTILTAIGVKIPGDRLALGTNLFSGIPTLAERVPDFANELTKYSKFYSRQLAGDLSAPMLRIVPQWMPARDLENNDTYFM